MLRFSWLSALRTLFPFRYRTRTTSQRRRALRRPLLCAGALEDRVVPAGRLFAAGALPTNGGPRLIYELNPSTGAVLNSFAAPEPAGLGAVGLAFDGTHLFYINGLGSDLFYELNPATGAVLDSDPLPLPGGVTGLGYLNGLVYLLTSSNQIVAFDPLTDTVVRTLQIPDPSFFGGLTGASGLGLLFATAGTTIYTIDPQTGAVVRTLNPNVGSLLGGLAYRSGELLAAPFSASGPAPVYRIDPQTGAVLGVLAAITEPVGALGGDGPGRTASASPPGPSSLAGISATG